MIHSVQWNLAVPSNSYLFRTYNLVEFLNTAGTPVASTAWILGDRYSTLVRVDTGNVSTTINQLAWGECRI